MNKVLAAIIVGLLFFTGACGGKAEEASQATKTKAPVTKTFKPKVTTLHVGQTADDGMVKTTLYSVKIRPPRHWTNSDGSKDSFNYTTVLVDAQQCAVKTGFQIMFEPWTLEDAQHRQYETVQTDVDDGPDLMPESDDDSKPMQAGQCKRGIVTFSVHGKTTPDLKTINYIGTRQFKWGV